MARVLFSYDWLQNLKSMKHLENKKGRICYGYNPQHYVVAENEVLELQIWI